MKLHRTNEYTLVIPKTGRMRVEGRIFADARVQGAFDGLESLKQVANVAQLPGIVEASMAMPDIHWGYGFPIGGVAGFAVDDGIVSPGGVGYDINCGVRLLRTDLKATDIKGKNGDLAASLLRNVPTGLGSSSTNLHLSREDIFSVATNGAKWAVEAGFGTQRDLDFIEDNGTMKGADPNLISQRAMERGAGQMGTLGSGNHFVELGRVEHVYNAEIANRLGLGVDTITVIIHTGSRGFGYQICSDYLELLTDYFHSSKQDLPDKQLVYAPISSSLGKQYFASMSCAANFAFANRQVIGCSVGVALEQFFAKSRDELGLRLVYDVAHNIARIEEHRVNQKQMRLCVHRKGATRALPPGHPLVPNTYKDIGAPVLIPGDMGRYSYVCVGGPHALERSLGSCAHGAGRLLSRNKALAATAGRKLADELRHKGISVRTPPGVALGEEASEAYKDVADIIRVVHAAGLATPVVRLTPLAVIKG